jgi:hypothetical protein
MRYRSARTTPGVNPPAGTESDEARRPTGIDDGLRRRAAASTDGDARFVGSCETDETGSPHAEQNRAGPETPEPQFGQAINGVGSYRPPGPRGVVTFPELPPTPPFRTRAGCPERGGTRRAP